MLKCPEVPTSDGEKDDRGDRLCCVLCVQVETGNVLATAVAAYWIHTSPSHHDDTVYFFTRARTFRATQWKKKHNNRQPKQQFLRPPCRRQRHSRHQQNATTVSIPSTISIFFFIRSHGLAAGLFGRSFSVTTQAVGREAVAYEGDLI